MNSKRLGSIREVQHIQLSETLGQCRTSIVNLGKGITGILAAHSRCSNLDPWMEAYTFPTDTLKLSMIDPEGRIMWTRNLGEGTSPGIWFCPVLPFDIDNDGRDEIFFVQNKNFHLPFSIKNTKLVGLDSGTGGVLGEWSWTYECGEKLSHSLTFRNCLIEGYAGAEPVLVTSRGTYGDMFFEAYGRNMKPLWKKKIPAAEPGARASHQCLVVDINGDGIDEILWGERCLSIKDGGELFCADRDTWQGHSDLVLPVWDRQEEAWYIFACRESFLDVGPRNCFYNARGERLWGHVDYGHMHVNWVARTESFPGRLAFSLKIDYHETRADQKSLLIGPQPHFFDLSTGKEIGEKELASHGLQGLDEAGRENYKQLELQPVDLNGDGYHEFFRFQGGQVLDSSFNVIAEIGGATTLLAAHICDEYAGEQILTFTNEGALCIWADSEAQDTPEAKARYDMEYYRRNMKSTGVGYNRMNLAGV